MSHADPTARPADVPAYRTSLSAGTRAFLVIVSLVIAAGVVVIAVCSVMGVIAQHQASHAAAVAQCDQYSPSSTDYYYCVETATP